MFNFESALSFLNQPKEKPAAEYAVLIRVLFPEFSKDIYKEIVVAGYSSLQNAQVAAGVFSELGEDIVMVFKDYGITLVRPEPQIEVCVRLIPGGRSNAVPN